MTDTKARYVYGIAHVENGKVDNHERSMCRENAERDLRVCRQTGAACYLVRYPLVSWERVPDGE